MDRAHEMGERAGEMTRRSVPVRHWRTYGDYPLPSGIEARDEPFAAFPSRFLRIECNRCGKVQMINEGHFARPNMPIRAILAKMRHDGCGGLAGKAELLTGIEGVSSRPVRRIVLREG
jgi:ribosomal protein S27E